MRSLTVVAGIGIALTLGVTPVVGQEREQSPRSNLWFTVGAAYGSAGIECPDCMGLIDGRATGFSGMLGLGWTLTPSVVIGAETQWWFKFEAIFPLGIVTTNAIVLFYPLKTQGLWLKGGLGYMWAGVDAPGVSVVGTGMDWTLGAGYDIYLGSTIAFTPYLSYVGSGDITTTVNDITVDVSLNPNFFQLGVAITAP
jgi:hypothetical protein